MFELSPEVKVSVPTLILSGISERHTEMAPIYILVLVFWTIAKQNKEKPVHIALQSRIIFCPKRRQL